MKWLIGIAIVMGLAHLYFRRGQRRLEQVREGDGAAEAESTPQSDQETEPGER